MGHQQLQHLYLREILEEILQVFQSIEICNYDAKKINSWKQKYTHSYVISAKLDGISILYECKQNDRKLYTRGDGVCGLDISHLIPYLRLPNITKTAIRGELIISKQNFEKYTQK